MAVVFTPFSFTVTTTDTVNKVVTGLGVQPQALIFFASNRSSPGASLANGMFGDGMTDGTRQWAQTVGGLSGATSSQAGRVQYNNSCLALITSSQAIAARFAIASLDADGFTLTTQTTPTATYEIHGIALSGLTNVYLEVRQTPSATGNFSSTVPGFQPDAIIWMSGQQNVVGTTGAGYRASVGWSLTDGTQFSVCRVQNNANTSNYTSSVSASDRCLYTTDATGAPLNMDMSIVSHDANGYTVNRITGAAATYYAALCLQGGVWKAGTFAAQSSTGTFDVITTGCDPVGVMLASSNVTTVSRTSAEGGSVTIGAGISATERFASQWHAYNAETLNPNGTEEYQRTAIDKVWVNNERTAVNTTAAAGEIDISSMGTEKFTLDQTDGDPTAILIGWIAVGEAPAGGGGSRTFVPAFIG